MKTLVYLEVDEVPTIKLAIAFMPSDEYADVNDRYVVLAASQDDSKLKSLCEQHKEENAVEWKKWNEINDWLRKYEKEHPEVEMNTYNDSKLVAERYQARKRMHAACVFYIEGVMQLDVEEWLCEPSPTSTLYPKPNITIEWQYKIESVPLLV